MTFMPAPSPPVRRPPSEPTLVQLGCGPFAQPSSWVDFDGSWNARLNQLPRVLRGLVRRAFRLTGRTPVVFPSHIRYLNLHDRLPYADGSVDAVYASHVWEHLYYEDARRATAECFRVLRPGGSLRIVVPSLRLYCEKYLAEAGSREAALNLHGRLMYRDLARQKNALYGLYAALTGFHLHKFMYDEPALAALLADAGFGDVCVRPYLETSIPRLGEVEAPSRLLDGAGFAVEGTKPRNFSEGPSHHP